MIIMSRKSLNRREFLKKLGIGTGSAMALMALEPLNSLAQNNNKDNSGNHMTYRTQHGTGEKVSLLGFGMMRLPRDNQELVNQLVDYAIEHGVNYFDTAPMYGRGLNEGITGAALSRHPRDKYFVATKMSNYDEKYWTLEGARAMYENSFKQLRVDYIDYYLLHGVGQNGMEALENRFLKNGLLDFLVKEREAGRIRHLGFSYHGDVRDFDWLLDHNDEYHWDFVQIQMNFLDWRHASLEKGGWKVDADAEYLYNKLEKAGIQAVIMEPFRGGALSKMPEDCVAQLKAMHPGDSVARWAFRWVSSHPNILTTLSGMNVMEHLVENVATHSPLEPCTPAENELLEKIADIMQGIPTVPCTTCAYCMPCPYGVDIPGNFTFYNNALNNNLLPHKSDPDYATKQAQFVNDYFKAIPVAARANQCMDCEECLKKCPQSIRIPNQLSRINSVLRGR
ncbi:MAG: aldo/keto reductase [Muribaculaceae bacterium]|nr:aldo/keto reductase [Muribaculaceae bacterium]